MKVAIMQPYFLPYIGYFQLIGAVDAFVVYDNIKYTKKGWINRNRFLQNGSDARFTLPLKADADHLDVVQRWIADDFEPRKLLAQWAGAYSKAPCFRPARDLLAGLLACPERNLFGFIEHSLAETCRYLGITTPMIRSSSIPIDHELKGQDKVLAICGALGCRTYVNAIGGAVLYEDEAFQSRGIDLRFLRTHRIEYPQFGGSFVPNLSITDVMMFNPPGTIAGFLRAFDLVPRADALPPQEIP